MTANNNLVTNFNVDPYYDDYDENKNFHRILYRPGFAVQARELTQQQTILQNQIHRFGNHVFRDGSEVTGATEALDTVGVFRVKPTYAGSSVNVSQFEGLYVRSRYSEKLYRVKKAVTASGGEFDHLYVQYLQSANTNANAVNEYTKVSNNEILDFSASYINANNVFPPNSNVGSAQVLSTGDTNVAKLPVTTGFLYSTDESVHYHKGLFIRADKQTATVAPNVEHAVSIGFTSTETLVTSDSDTSLTDPARGSYNYAAPGADRLKVTLTLTTKPLSDIGAPPLTSNNYFEIARVKDGRLVRKRPDPDYNRLGDVLAQRTFEESGNYSVEGLNLTIANTISTAANLVANFSLGTAYVKGYRVHNPGTTDVALPKARALDTVTEQKITALYGNYVFISGLTTGLFNINDRIELHASTIPSAKTKIGEAHVRNIEYSTGSGANRIYKLFLYDVRVTASGFTINKLKSVLKGTHSSQTAFAQIDSSSITSFSKTATAAAGSADVQFNSVDGIKVGQSLTAAGFKANTVVQSILFDTVTFSNLSTVSNSQPFTFENVTFEDNDYNRNLFLMPHQHTANTVNIDYKFKRKFGDKTFSSGAHTIQTIDGKERFSGGTGALADTLKTENFIVVVKSGATASTPLGNLDMTAGGRSVTVSATPGNPGQALIDLNDVTFTGVCDIIAAIDVTDDTRRVKTRTVGTKTFEGGFPSSATSLSLGYADVIKINAIYMGNTSFVSANTSANVSNWTAAGLGGNTGVTTQISLVTNKFNFNKNARDSFYDHSTITLKPGEEASNNQILVSFDYYAHAGGLGYFSNLSYPDYSTIPSYTSKSGQVVPLRDVLDFRPTRSANTNSNTYSSSPKIFDSHQIVDSQTFEVEADYSYYKRLVHKLALDQTGEFVLSSGESRLNNPPIPQTSSDTMLLATVFMNPYTYNEKDLRIELEDNSRYTMRDIGSLEKRIENIEYYTSLNLLESQVQSAQFLDNNGDARFKNGFIVDPFQGHSVGNVFDPDYKVSIDRFRQVMRPRFTSDNVPVTPTSSTLNVSNKIVTLPFTEEAFVSQREASDTINVNPFQVVTFTGTAFLDPSSDTWTDTRNVNVTVNNNGDLDHLEYLQAQVGDGYEYGNWQATGAGVTETVKLQGNFAGTNDENAVNGPGVWNAQTTTQGQQSVTKKSIQVYTDSSTSRALTNSVFYPYMRTRKVNFTIEGARPNTKMFLFIGGVDCTDHMAPNTFASDRAEKVLYSGSFAREVVTDQFGAVSGYFWVPNNRQVLSSSAYLANPNATVLPDGSNARNIGPRFEAGDVDIIFCDNLINPQFSTSFVATTFTSKGKLDTYTTTTTMTRRYELVRKQTGYITSAKTERGFFLTTADDPQRVYNEISGQPRVDHDGNPIGGVYVVDADAKNVGENFIAARYEQVIGRRPEVAGYKYWLERYLGGEFGPVGSSNTQTMVNLAASIQTAANINASKADPNSPNYDPNWNCEQYYDPLAQTFQVPGEFYPEGIFVTSVDVFIAQKDSNNLPLRVELRRTVNGFPSADEIIPLSRVTLKPSEINANATSLVATRVNFKAPIHLRPGEYALVMLTDSLEYITHISTIGNERINGTGFVTDQPTLGSLFKSQNARTWTAQQESDLCFVLNKAKFTTGSNFNIVVAANNIGRAAYDANTVYANTVGQYDIAHINMKKYDDQKNIKAVYEIRTKNAGGSLLPYEKVLPNQDLYFSTSKEIATNNDLQMKVTFRSEDEHMSPYFDLGTTAVTLVKNIINVPPTVNFVAETEPSNNYALSRYITRRVTLGEGLDASSLKVFVDQNMPAGASVEVYYRVINKDDDSNFDERPYVLMTRRQASTIVNEASDLFNEYEYFADDISYVNGNANYNNFNTFSIKIVMYATNSAGAPSFRNFRAIALA